MVMVCVSKFPPTFGESFAISSKTSFNYSSSILYRWIPKVGTVTPNVAEAVKNAKAGQVQYRTDKAGIVHATIGRASFAEADLKENFDALLDAIVKAKPAAAKGQYLKKVAVSSTMGLGVRVDTSSVNN